MILGWTILDWVGVVLWSTGMVIIAVWILERLFGGSK